MIMMMFNTHLIHKLNAYVLHQSSMLEELLQTYGWSKQKCQLATSARIYSRLYLSNQVEI